MTPKRPDEPTREIPEYSPGRGRASVDDVGWPDDADQIGKPLDTDGMDDAARQQLVEPRGGLGRKLLVVAGVIAIIAALAFGARAINLWPDFKNPFAQEQTDRSQPPLLKSIQDLSRYEAAQGNFEVIVDLQNNRRWIPDFLVNERTLFVGAGSVQAYVDFGAIAEGNVIVSPDGKSVELKLPAPQLEEPNLDLERSYVFAQERGVINKFGDLIGGGDPNRQQEVYQRAEQKIAESAINAGLQQRAEENTKKMLESLLRSLGYETVTITFVAP